MSYRGDWRSCGLTSATDCRAALMPESIDRTRIIDLNPLTIDVLAEHLETQTQTGRFYSAEPPRDAMVFRG